MAGDVEAVRLAATLGQQVRKLRRAARMTQGELGQRVGLHTSRMSSIELGMGAEASLRTWVRLGIALGRPLAVSLSGGEGHPLPAQGHLDIQEALVQLLRTGSYRTMVELATRPLNPAHSIDVAGRDADGNYLLLEIWNTFGDIGAALRSTDRKRAELGGLARGEVRVCWVIRATASNRATIARYPGILQSRFPGSSAKWAAALAAGDVPPLEPGIVWWADDRPVAVRWPSHRSG